MAGMDHSNHAAMHHQLADTSALSSDRMNSCGDDCGVMDCATSDCSMSECSSFTLLILSPISSQSLSAESFGVLTFEGLPTLSLASLYRPPIT